MPRPRRIHRSFLTTTIVAGLSSSIIAGAILAGAIAYLYRTSITRASDRIALTHTAALLNDALIPMLTDPQPARSNVRDLAMTVDHVRMLVPSVEGITLTMPGGVRRYGLPSGHYPSHSTEMLPLHDRRGTVVGTVAIVVANRQWLDATTLAFIISLSMTAPIVAALPQLALARVAVRELSQQRRAAEDAHVATLVSLSHSLEFRDPYTANHSKRVAAYAVAVARTMGLDDATIETTRVGALLHDLGKIGVADQILLKDGPLTDDERAAMQQHPVIGSELLADHERLADIRLCVLHHHERLDGAGYPYGLRGHEILLAARIIAVADAYDAMTTDRPYRRALPQQSACARLVAGSGTQWDGACVTALLAAVGYEATHDDREVGSLRHAHAGTRISNRFTS